MAVKVHSNMKEATYATNKPNSPNLAVTCTQTITSLNDASALE